MTKTSNRYEIYEELKEKGVMVKYTARRSDRDRNTFD